MNQQLVDYLDGINKRKLDFKTEKHHIIPRCKGGTDETTNLVLFTPKEHYVAHHLLSKIYPNDDSLFLAYRMMACMDNDCLNRNVNISAKEYQCIKERLSNWRHSFKFSEEALAKMRKKRKHTDNMRKPKTRTAALIAEQERRKALGFFKGENNPLYGSHFEWYNDGMRNYRITSTDNTDGLTKGKLQKKRVI